MSVMEGRTTSALLYLDGVHVSFDGFHAINNLSLTLEPGEMRAIIGPNGAGKTTLFDVISGFTAADTGSIRLLSGDRTAELHGQPTHVRSWRGLGRSFQDGRLFPGLTVHEAIAVALEQHVDVRDPIAATLLLPSVPDSEQQECHHKARALIRAAEEAVRFAQAGAANR